jgi:hypothetical protein
VFYLHEFGDIAATFCSPYDSHFYQRWCREAYEALLRHEHCTLDPERGAYSVASATLRCVSFAEVDWGALSTNVADLAARTRGKPLLVFDGSDLPHARLEAPQMIVCKSAWHRDCYSPARSISIPQFPRFSWEREPIRASARKFLAGFKGDPRPEWNSLRSRLLSLDNDRDFIVKAAVLTPAHVKILPSGAATEDPPPGEISFVELMYNSTFALLPRANGYALSYRMIESMNAGCIPVILSDGYVLPFSEVLDYEPWSVRVAESDIDKLPDLLRERLHDADRMQREMLQVYHACFSSTERIIRKTLEIAERMVH